MCGESRPVTSPSWSPAATGSKRGVAAREVPQAQSFIPRSREGALTVERYDVNDLARMSPQRAQVGCVANQRSAARDDGSLSFNGPAELAEVVFDRGATNCQSGNQLSANFAGTDFGENVAMLPERIAEAIGLPIDRSFVAIVPLGGRHVNHLWKLLRGLDIPFATLLDLDFGRDGGAWLRIKGIVDQLLSAGVKPGQLFSEDELKGGLPKALQGLSTKNLQDEGAMNDWIARLRKFAIFLCDPLDLDMTMLTAYSEEYRVLENGMQGPANDDQAARAVLGKQGDPEAYADEWADDFGWYRYLFLGRSKPATHVRVISRIEDKVLSERAPEVLKALLVHVTEAIGAAAEDEALA
jgi:hypothetical protein